MKHTHLPTVLLLALALGACGGGDSQGFEGSDDAGESVDVDDTPSTGQSSDGGRPDASRRDAASAPGALDSSTPAPVRDAATPPSVADAGPVASSDDVPAGDHCAPVAAWDANSASFEQEVLRLTNEARAVGHNCDTEGNFGPTTPLKMEPRLRCSARLHSKYMAESGDFAHDEAADGSTPFTRMTAAGYKFNAAGENIAAGQATPASVVSGWLDSDGHCSNIMNPSYVDLGVGYVVGKPLGGKGKSSPYWTQNFGKSSR